MIMVICDLIDDSYKQINLELLSKARHLTSINQSTVTAISVGGYHKNTFMELHRFGAHKIKYSDLTQYYNYRIISKLVQNMIKKYSPSLVMFPATSLYKSVAAAVSVYCCGGLIADCIEIQLDDKSGYKFTRAAMGASVIAEIVCINTNVRLCTIKQNVFRKYVTPVEISDTLDCELVEVEKNDVYGKTVQLIEKFMFEKEECNNLPKAKMILSLGRGVNRSDVDTIKEIAKKYGAEIGGTRALVEGGMIPKTRQIGQSGITVMPNLYIAIGISGASQHIVGMKNSKKIIAINHDEHAPIFDYADYAIIDDTHSVINCLKKLLIQ